MYAWPYNIMIGRRIHSRVPVVTIHKLNSFLGWRVTNWRVTNFKFFVKLGWRITNWRVRNCCWFINSWTCQFGWRIDEIKYVWRVHELTKLIKKQQFVTSSLVKLTLQQFVTCQLVARQAHFTTVNLTSRILFIFTLWTYNERT